MEVLSGSASQTQAFGREFAAGLKGGEILALVGNLGSGKTTFVQGLADGLGVTQSVASPTFVLMRQYATKSRKLYHVDLYRLEKDVAQEYKSLGLDEIIEKGGNIVVVEWAEKIRNVLPKDTIWINFETIDENTRRIVSR